MLRDRLTSCTVQHRRRRLACAGSAASEEGVHSRSTHAALTATQYGVLRVSLFDKHPVTTTAFLGVIVPVTHALAQYAHYSDRREAGSSVGVASGDSPLTLAAQDSTHASRLTNRHSRLRRRISGSSRDARPREYGGRHASSAGDTRRGCNARLLSDGEPAASPEHSGSGRSTVGHE
jgi:hypothetical protein